MTRRVSLRPWQREALARFEASRPENFLTVACPGAGKTTFALAAARQRMAGERLPLVIVVPTQHLKRQWAEAAVRFGFHLDPQWSPDQRRLPADMHGIVTTYAQVASAAPVLAQVCQGGLVVLDEIHHAGGERSWGEGVQEAFEAAACRLLLSGTPFRSDDRPIPFVSYTMVDHGDAVADFEYGYGEALVDGGVVRPVFFPRFDGRMEWINSLGERWEATFDDDLLHTEWSARLRTALDLDGEWLPTIIDHAHGRLEQLRGSHPNAAGLIIATDQDHARGIARMLERRHGVEARIALSDDPGASDVIARFARTDDPWIVAVRMISEGVDIPRLRVGVFATTTTTAMFFRQAVGRIARWTPGIRSQRAYLYLPDDSRLRHHASTIAEARRHSIDKRRGRADDRDPSALDELAQAARQEEQLSLFAALSSTVVGETAHDDGLDHAEDIVELAEDLIVIPVDLPPPPALPGRSPADSWADLPDEAGTGEPATDGLGELRTRRAEKQRLRERNADRALTIVRLSGLPHSHVNAELNRKAGIRRINDATVAQLEKRAVEAARWLDELGR
ncbi:MAG: DEAD/DEAH box helicase [Acidimicrobiales bacterium]|nr:DEAD/DEAH box helicase [Acidimicrobiales bacterium]